MPLDLHHSDFFISQSSGLSANNGYRLLSVGNIFSYTDILNWQYVHRIRYILSKHRNMKHWVYLAHLWRQGQSVGYSSNSVQNLEGSDIPRCQLSLFSKPYQSFHRGYFEKHMITHIKLYIPSFQICVALLSTEGCLQSSLYQGHCLKSHPDQLWPF